MSDSITDACPDNSERLRKSPIYLRQNATLGRTDRPATLCEANSIYQTG
jgi:hypothetical protein